MSSAKRIWVTVVVLSAVVLLTQCIVSLYKVPVADDFLAQNDALAIQRSGWAAVLQQKLTSDSPRIVSFVLKTIPYTLFGLNGVTKITWLLALLFFGCVAGLLIHWIYKLMNITLNLVDSITLTLVVTSILSLSTPSYYEIWLWLPGLFVHGVPILFFLLLGILAFKPPQNQSVPAYLWIIIIILVLGMINELAVYILLAVSLFWSFCALLQWLRQKPNSQNTLIILSIFIISSFAILLVYKLWPGTTVRADKEGIVVLQSAFNSSDATKQLYTDITRTILNLGTITSIPIGYFIAKYSIDKNTIVPNTIKNFNKLVILVFVSCCIGLTSLSFLPQILQGYYQPLRIYTIIQLSFSICGLLLGVALVLNNHKNIVFQHVITGTVGILLLAGIVINESSQNFSYKLVGEILACNTWYTSELLPSIQKNKDIVLSTRCKVGTVLPLSSYSTYWYNKAVSEYFGLNSIKIQEK
jgi:hypothetical protein